MNRKLKAKIVEIAGTQAEFSKLVGDGADTISRVVNGLQILPFWKQKVWAEALGSEVDQLFNQENNVVSRNYDDAVVARAQKIWDTEAETRAEFGDDFASFVAYTAAKERGQVQVISGRCKVAKGDGK